MLAYALPTPVGRVALWRAGYKVLCALSFKKGHCVYQSAGCGLNIREQLGETSLQIRSYCRATTQRLNNDMTKCPVMKAFNTKGKVINVYCGQWSCPRCAKMLSKQWGWRVRIHIEKSGRQAYFWTFTLPGTYRTAAEGFAAIPEIFSRLREKLRAQPGKWEYCAFVEGQPQRGYMPHFHIISLTRSPRRIKDLAVSIGFGYMATETKVTSSKAGMYCAKYASKQSPLTPKGFRRVRTSHGWSKLPDTGPGDPYIVRSKNEHLWQYFLRVHEATGVSMELIQDRWSLGPFDPTANP